MNFTRLRYQGLLADAMFVAFVAVGLAFGLASSAAAQAPQTASEFRTVLGQAADAAEEVQAAEDEHTTIEGKVHSYKQRLEQHNRQKCTYPQGHPEVCAQYTANKKALDTEKTNLLVEIDNNAARRGYAKSHYNLLLARLRIANFLGPLEAWKNRVVECAGRPPAAARACLKHEWEHVPPISR
jgi:hypothetical protein